METKQISYRVKKMNGDVLTPISVFLRLKGEKKFLLESSMKHEEQGRYSFIGANPIFELVGEGDDSKVLSASGEIMERKKGKPLEHLKELLVPVHIDEIPFPLYGGAVGYVGYDAVRLYVPIGEEIEDDIQMPDIHFMVFDKVVVFDHLTQAVYLIAVDLKGESTEVELEERLRILEEQITTRKINESLLEGTIKFQPTIAKEEFMKQVEEARKYILRGEVEQVVLSQRMVGKVETDPFHYYRILRNSNPSPYMFYVDFADYIVLGASPESFVKTRNSSVFTNPIAGTRKRGSTPEEDEALTKELLTDEKEVMEHRILVEGSWRDLQKLCIPETIQLKKSMKVEYFRHVMHIVSELEGKMKEGIDGIDALITCLPAGTVSGEPKPRAMQIINEIEGKKRGVYAGALGYININGDVDFAITIRSLVIKDGNAYLQAGAGIVKDSQPEYEYNETMNKAMALLQLTPLK